MTDKAELNDLYERWRTAALAERPDFEQQQMYPALKRHAQAELMALNSRLAMKNPDLAHEVASAAIRDIGQFRGNSKFSTWVYEIAKNRVLMERRTLERHPEQPFDEGEEPSVPFPLEIDLRVELDQIEDTLEPEQKPLFRGMRDGKRLVEMAEEEGRHPEAVRSQKRGILRDLREKYR